jgi:hypothetical protein
VTQGAAEVLSRLHSRVFKGVLLSADISAREELGELIPPTPVSTAAELLGEYSQYFSRELRDRAVRMTYVYGLFFCFENSVRDLVSQRLLERKGSNWWDACVPENVKKRVEQKKTDILDNAWHQSVIAEDIDHTLFGDLGSIIVKEWQEFEELFPNQHWVKQRLDELERSRNIIAHGNVLPDAEIERLEQYLDDWLRQVP